MQMNEVTYLQSGKVRDDLGQLVMIVLLSVLYFSQVKMSNPANFVMSVKRKENLINFGQIYAQWQ